VKLNITNTWTGPKGELRYPEWLARFGQLAKYALIYYTNKIYSTPLKCYHFPTPPPPSLLNGFCCGPLVTRSVSVSIELTVVALYKDKSAQGVHIGHGFSIFDPMAIA
jgi:hypothetical protein